MDAREFLGLTATHNPHRWVLPVVPGISSGMNAMFGGCGLGAAISAMEATTGRPCVWATAQYLSFARDPEIVDIDVMVPVSGHQISQARAVAHVGDREILTVNAALGSRPLPDRGQWATFPVDVPPPDDCPRRESTIDPGRSILGRLDMRVARGRLFEDLDGTPSSDGHTVMWVRICELGDTCDATTLAILGDYVPMGIGQALGKFGGGNSLDNTIRVGTLVPCEWVLLDIHVDLVGGGFGHGTVNMWSPDGVLVGMASQSCIVRFFDEARMREARAAMGERVVSADAD
jgi:acyl-CoA thioesterase II